MCARASPGELSSLSDKPCEAQSELWAEWPRSNIEILETATWCVEKSVQNCQLWFWTPGLHGSSRFSLRKTFVVSPGRLPNAAIRRLRIPLAPLQPTQRGRWFWGRSLGVFCSGQKDKCFILFYGVFISLCIVHWRLMMFDDFCALLTWILSEFPCLYLRPKK